MKQTSKLTRRQREFLEERGIEDTEKLRFCCEDKVKFVFFDTESGRKVEVSKAGGDLVAESIGE